MSAQPLSESNFLPATFRFSENQNSFLRDLNILYRRIASAIKDREIARYDVVDQATGTITPPGFERQTGQVWSGATNQTPRYGWRKVVIFPVLAVGTNTQPHNLGPLTNFQFTRIDGVLQNPTGQQFVPAPNNNVYVDVLGANVEIILPTGSAYTGFKAQIVLEYLKSLLI